LGGERGHAARGNIPRREVTSRFENKGGEGATHISGETTTTEDEETHE